MVPVIVSVTSAAEDLSGAGIAQGIKNLTPKTSLVEAPRELLLY